MFSPVHIFSRNILLLLLLLLLLLMLLLLIIILRWTIKNISFCLTILKQISPKLQFNCMSSHYLQTVDISSDKIDTFLSKKINILSLELKRYRHVYYEYKNQLLINRMILECGFYVCKDQLLINTMILNNCFSKQKNQSTALIDYRMALDSLLYVCILKYLNIYNLPPVVINLYQTMYVDMEKLIATII